MKESGYRAPRNPGKSRSLHQTRGDSNSWTTYIFVKEPGPTVVVTRWVLARGDEPRARILGFDARTGSLLEVAAAVDPGAKLVDVVGSTIWVLSPRHISRINTVRGAVSRITPRVGELSSLAADESDVRLAGENGLARLDARTGAR
jgi:hypothetical protein